MQGKIALEEHFSTEEFLEDIKPYFVREGKWEEGKATICDISGKRLEEMDANGIEYNILSLSSPTIQGICSTADAIVAAKNINDYLAQQIQPLPRRLGGFAALPTQDPEASILELQRCVKDFNFKGALVNGFCTIDDPENAIYLDDPRYLPFWEEVEKLGVPIYLHPRMSVPSVRKKEYAGHDWMISAAWGFHVETATHCLRLMASGLFDRFPKLQIVIGHMGELLPFQIWRICNRVDSHKRDCKAEKTFTHYLENNFHITTSGNCSTPALLCTMLETGADRIMFSTDYPYETMSQAANWFDNLPVSNNDKLKMGRTNAQKLFHLEFLDD